MIEARNALVGPDGTASQILLVAPVPVAEVGVLADMFLGGAEKSRALGAKMAVVAERQQTGFLDLADVAQVDMTDGIHLDADAHAAIGAAMAKAVLRTLP